MSFADYISKFPQRWHCSSLGELLDFKNGINFSANQKGEGVLTVDVLNMYGDQLNVLTDNLYRVDVQLQKDKLLQKGDILFVRSSVKESGVGWPAMFDGCDEPVTYCGFIIRGQPIQKNFDPRFLIYYLRQPQVRQQMVASSGKTAITNISQERLKPLIVPLPSLEEQRRIAAILDKADAVRRKRKEAIALTEELLRSAFLDMFGDPVTNPKGWDVLPMHEVIQTIEAGWSANGEDRRCESDEWGVLKISAVTSGRFQVNEHKVVEEILPNKSLIIPSKGDLLFSRANTRELVAATCLVDKNCERLFLPDKLWRIKPKPKFANTEYLKFLLSNPKYRSLIARKATGTSGSMLNVSQAKLLEMYAPIPDLQKQRCFAEVVWQIFGMREQHELTTIESNSMFNSLLQKAFRGEL